MVHLDPLDPHQPSQCITLLYIFEEMHFDLGINDWLCKGPSHEIRSPGFSATCRPLTRLKDTKLGGSVLRQEGHISDST
ncbi:hypothetical protein MJG53_019217 [Ovis ammon polii x Ovis aries]|uniref:Uncharacterized protein n=1 Tax=Ovis ammon polii x Ovis aries TaxID=2918886 RepID=A0ACB9U275_9CETA|nr:hypothetical protein MJG53_019217 [Ovis ammon polii x Ovis aries]